MRNINQIEWRELVANDQSAVIIDTRTLIEWKDGILENAILMDVFESESFQVNSRQLEKEKNYYVYCRSGQRSQRACQVLEALGVANTFNLSGGILEWNGNIVMPT